MILGQNDFKLVLSSMQKCMQASQDWFSGFKMVFSGFKKVACFLANHKSKEMQN